jgi:hypothetical protein
MSGRRRASVGTRRRMTGPSRGMEEAAVGWHRGRGGGSQDGWGGGGP